MLLGAYEYPLATSKRISPHDLKTHYFNNKVLLIYFLVLRGVVEGFWEMLQEQVSRSFDAFLTATMFNSANIIALIILCVLPCMRFLCLFSQKLIFCKR